MSKQSWNVLPDNVSSGTTPGGEKSSTTPGRTLPFSLRQSRAEAEVIAISQALEQTNWNRRQAAQLLGISYRSLFNKIRQHQLDCGKTAQFASVPDRTVR